MNNLMVQIMTKAYKIASIQLYKKTSRLCNSQKIVSFTFDDFPESAALNGASVLENHNVRGTFYTCFDLAGKDSPSGKIAETEAIEVLKDKNHEIGCHTFSHLNCAISSLNEIAIDCAKNRTYAENVLGLRLSNFAFPMGNIKPKAKREVGKKYTSARIIKQGINQSFIDLLALKSVPLYSKYPTEKYFRWLDFLDKNGGWLIFYTHDVESKPSHYGCTIELFETIVEKCINMKYEILTINGVINDKLDLLS